MIHTFSNANVVGSRRFTVPSELGFELHNVCPSLESMVCDSSAIRTEIIRVGEGGATDCLFFLTYFVIRSFSFSTRPCVFGF